MAEPADGTREGHTQLCAPPVMARMGPTRPQPMVCPSTTPWKTLHVIEPRMSALICNAGGVRYLVHQFSGPHVAGNALANPVYERVVIPPAVYEELQRCWPVM